MKTRTKRILLAFGGLLLLGVGCVTWLGYLLLSPDSSLNRASAIDCTLTWGRLAPFPASAQQIAVTTQGNMFTRGFRASFVASAADIEQWLQQSPGTREASPESPSSGLRVFHIKPGGGARFAEVAVDDHVHCVSVHVYWS